MRSLKAAKGHHGGSPEILVLPSFGCGKEAMAAEISGLGLSQFEHGSHPAKEEKTHFKLGVAVFCSAKFPGLPKW